MNLKLFFLMLALGWTIAIMVACWVPITIVIPIQESSGWWVFELPDFDKIVHFGIFSIFAVLWYLGLSRPGRSRKILAGAIALAALTELVQRLPMIGRQSDFDDACYDVAGAIVGLLIIGAVTGYLMRQPNPSLESAAG